MVSLFLACCVRGMEVTRHFTPELGTIVAGMLGVAVVAGGLLLLFSPVIVRRRV